MNGISCVIYGTPQPKGSKRAFINKHTNKVVMIEDSARTKPWMQCAIVAIREKLPRDWQPMDGPLLLDARFFFRRPKGHTLKQRENPWCFTRIDRDKMLRALGDALTQSGAIVDDKRICAGYTSVLYAEDGEAERTELRVERIIPGMYWHISISGGDEMKGSMKGGMRPPKGMPMKDKDMPCKGGKKK